MAWGMCQANWNVHDDVKQLGKEVMAGRNNLRASNTIFWDGVAVSVDAYRSGKDGARYIRSLVENYYTYRRRLLQAFTLLAIGSPS